MSKETKTTNNNISRILVLLVAVAGLAIMVYLTYIHVTQKESFCNISEAISCDVVTTGIYSEVFGVPVSILGILYFTVVLLLMIFNKKDQVFQTVFLLTLFVLFPSLYLTSLELLVIHAWCILCESSKILMIAILIISFLAAKQHIKITGKLVAPIIIAGVLAVIVTFFAQSGTVVKQDYTEFTDCLREQNVVYYMSFRCSNCQRQEKLFGEENYSQLNAIECHPEGENGQPERCLEMGIDKTPTFLIEEDGREVKRKEGLTPLDDLAEFAGCPFDY